MKYYTGQTYTKEHNGHTYRIHLEPDYDADTSIYGQYTSKPDDVTYCVWRTDGTLRGGAVPEPEEPDVDAETMRAKYSDTAEGLAAFDEDWDNLWDEYDEAIAEWENAGPVILADGLPRAGWHEYEYFVPFCGGSTPESGDLSLEEWTRYAIQEYRRMEDLQRGGWGFVGVVVEVDAPACTCCGHVETLVTSLWGCETDYSDSDFDEVIEDLISDLEHQIDKYDLAREAQVAL